jgi:hypothetical protein
MDGSEAVRLKLLPSLAKCKEIDCPVLEELRRSQMMRDQCLQELRVTGVGVALAGVLLWWMGESSRHQ